MKEPRACWRGACAATLPADRVDPAAVQAQLRAGLGPAIGHFRDAGQARMAAQVDPAVVETSVAEVAETCSKCWIAHLNCRWPS